jgi:hypothetical protein
VPRRNRTYPPGMHRTQARQNPVRKRTQTADHSVHTPGRARARNYPSRPRRCAAVRWLKAHFRRGCNRWEKLWQKNRPSTPEGVKPGRSRNQRRGRKRTSPKGIFKRTRGPLDLAFPGTRCSAEPRVPPPAAFAGLPPGILGTVRTYLLSCAQAPRPRAGARGGSRRSGGTKTPWCRSSRPCRQYLAWPLRQPRVRLAQTCLFRRRLLKYSIFFLSMCYRVSFTGATRTKNCTGGSWNCQGCSRSVAVRRGTGLQPVPPAWPRWHTP